MAAKYEEQKTKPVNMQQWSKLYVEIPFGPHYITGLLMVTENICIYYEYPIRSLPSISAFNILCTQGVHPL